VVELTPREGSYRDSSDAIPAQSQTLHYR